MVNGPIVVGYLATDEGEAALSVAVQEAQLRSSRLIVVISRRRGEDPSALASATDAVRDRLDEAGVGYEVRELENGRDIADDLLDTAEENEAVLIVIGLRRRSPVGKLILGSNAQRILLDAATPVLAVKSS